MIIKKFTIVYGNVKSFNLLMRDFCQAYQREEETIPSFATRIEGLLSQIRDRFPDQLPHQEEQRLLKDCLFHGSRKSIRDSLKFCFADATLDYMYFLEECMKSEEEGKAGQAKTAPKAKAAAATGPPTKQDELTEQLRYQQQQIDALVGQVKNLVSVVRATQASSSVARPENPSFGRGGYGRKTQGTWRGGSWGRGLSSQTQSRSTSQHTVKKPQQEQGAGKTYIPNQCWQCQEMGHLKHDCPTLKDKGLFEGECLNSPHGLKRHSPTEKPRANNGIGSKSATGGKEAETLVRQAESTHADLWTKLVGRANEDQIFINGHPVIALLDNGSQVAHVNQDLCLAKGIQIHPIN